MKLKEKKKAKKKQMQVMKVWGGGLVNIKKKFAAFLSKVSDYRYGLANTDATDEVKVNNCVTF